MCDYQIGGYTVVGVQIVLQRLRMRYEKKMLYKHGTGEQTMNKQIEEMVVLMCGERKKHKSCKACKSGNPNANAYCRIEHYAEALYNAGYRKSTDVAREIFEEIEGLMWDAVIGGKYPAKVINPDKYAELKQKYESEGEE